MTADVVIGLVAVATLLVLYIAAKASRAPERNPFKYARGDLDYDLMVDKATAEGELQGDLIRRTEGDAPNHE